MARNEISNGISPQEIVKGLGVYGKSYGDSIDASNWAIKTRREVFYTTGIISDSRKKMEKNPTAILAAAHLLDDTRTMLHEKDITLGIFPTEHGFRERLVETLDIHLQSARFGAAHTYGKDPDDIVSPQEIRIMMLSTGITGKYADAFDIAKLEGVSVDDAKVMIDRSKKVVLNSLIDGELEELESKAK